ncbi:hypothetical protein P5V15_003981 [Pogonomyrmex californicus]
MPYLISEMEHNFKCGKLHEKMVYQQYVDKYATFFASSTFAVFLTASGITLMPLVTDEIFPLDTKYPFDIERGALKPILYLQQASVFWQTFSIVCLSTFFGLLILFTAARFDILSQQFRTVTDICDIIECIRQHIKLLK